MKSIFKFKNKNNLSTKVGWIATIGLGINILVLILYSYYNFRSNSVNLASQVVATTAKDYSKEINAFFEKPLFEARSLALSLSAVNETEYPLVLSREEAEIMASKILKSDPSYLGFTLAWEPNQFDAKDDQYVSSPKSDFSGRFISYLSKRSNDILIEPLVDYENPEKGSWYLVPKKSKKEMLNGPIMYPVQGMEVFLLSLMSPIVSNDKFLGVTGIDITIEYLQDLVKKQNLFEGNGVVSILSNEGICTANSSNINLVGKKLHEYSTDWQTDMKLIKEGKSFVKIEDGVLLAGEPIFIGTDPNPWQVRISVPMSVIMSESNSILVNLIWRGIVLTLISIVIIVFFIRRSLKPISVITDDVKQLSEGNLKVQINKDYIKRTDEIGTLTYTVQNLILKLNEIIRSIQLGAEQISRASQQISNASLQLSESANEQASSVEEISSTMEEISANIQQNMSNAELTVKTSIEANEGINAVAQRAVVAVAANKNILDKISVINDIAFQTNILALNAAVEAARAGNQGRGFAVVAAEVRKLAERSKVAASEIVTLTKESYDLASGAGQIMGETMPKVQNTSSLVQEITSASKEQSNGVDQVSNSIQLLNSITQETAASSEELATNAEELTSQAQHLRSLVAYFKL